MCVVVLIGYHKVPILESDTRCSSSLNLLHCGVHESQGKRQPQVVGELAECIRAPSRASAGRLGICRTGSFGTGKGRTTPRGKCGGPTSVHEEKIIGGRTTVFCTNTYRCWLIQSTMAPVRSTAIVRHSKFYIDDRKPFVTLLVRKINPSYRFQIRN